MTAITSNGTGGGNWSATASWTGAAVPVEGNTVIIQNGDTITIDQNVTVGADTATAAIDVASGGKLEVLSTVAADYTLTLKGDLKISSGGTLEIGTAVNPIPVTRKFTIELNYSASLAEGKYGLLNYGEMILQGKSKTVETLLTANLSAAGTVWTVGDTTDWEVGDRLAIASTSRTWSEAEDKAIQTVDSATQVTMTAGATNAHSGTSPTQAEVINLTRNVKITSYNTSYRGYVCCHLGSTQDIDYVEFYMIGYNATYKRGIEIRTKIVDDTNFAYCSVWGRAASNYSFYLYQAQYVTVNNCVIYNTDEQFTIEYLSTNNIITDNVIMAVNDYGLEIRTGGNTVSDNTVTSCYNVGVYSYLSYSPQIQTINNLISHSNRQPGFSAQLGTWTFTGSIKIWRNNVRGLQLTSCYATFKNLEVFGNQNQNVDLNGAKVDIDNLVSNGDSSFSTTYGLKLMNINGESIITDAIFSDVSGIKTAHTKDIYFYKGSSISLVCKNCKLLAATQIYNIENGILGSSVQCEDLGQVAYADKAWYKNGVVIRDSAIYKSNSYSTRFDYQYNNAAWLEYDIYIPVKNGEQIVVSSWLRKNASYTDANRPKIVLSGQGITEDEAQMTDVTDTWERVTVQGTPTRTGLAKLTIKTYLVNSGASAWADFVKTDILSGVLNTIEGEFWANGHIAEVFMDTGSITAAEFWKTLTADVNSTGSFAKLFKDCIDDAISGRAPANEYDTELAAIQAKTDTIDWDNITSLIDEIGGKWEITGNQMIFYKADNATEIMRFNLFDADGNPATKNIYKRERVP